MLFLVVAALLALPLMSVGAQEAADLDAIKEYLLEKTAELQDSTATLVELAQQAAYSPIYVKLRGGSLAAVE